MHWRRYAPAVVAACGAVVALAALHQGRAEVRGAPTGAAFKVLAGFATVMERGKSGPRCLQWAEWTLEALSGRIVPGLVVNVFDGTARVEGQVDEFCTRYAAALRAVKGTGPR